MVKCSHGNEEGRCALGGGICSAGRPHPLKHAIDRSWIDKTNGSYICGHPNHGPINVEDADLSPQEDKEA